MSVCIERTFEKISFDHDCWRWNGTVDSCGYGRACSRMYMADYRSRARSSPRSL